MSPTLLAAGGQITVYQFSYYAPCNQHLPDDIVHADNVLGLVTGVVDDGRPGLQPHPVTVLTQEPVVLAHRSSLHYH